MTWEKTLLQLMLTLKFMCRVINILLKFLAYIICKVNILFVNPINYFRTSKTMYIYLYMESNLS